MPDNSPAKPPHGWYDDGSGRQRWWDGNQWTTSYKNPADAAAQAPAASASARARRKVPTLLIVGFAGCLLAGIIAAVTGGFGGFLVGIALPALVTAIIGLWKHRRTWLGLRKGGLIGATAASAALILLGALLMPATSPAPPVAAPVAATATPTPVETHTATPTPTASPTTASNPGQGQDAATVLATLSIKPDGAATGYDRVVDFGPAWMDIAHNGCDTRDDILARDLTDVTRDGACKVVSGVLADPYTGKTIDFTRGVTTSAQVQIDHVVPLADAWVTGAALLTLAQRETLANDPLNLLAVDGPTNEAKSDKDASEWLPPNAGYDCPYVARQIAVKATYALWVTQAEHDRMAAVLATCPGEKMPVSTFATGPVVTAPVPQPQAPPAPAPGPAAPAPAAPAPAPEPAAPPAGGIVHPGAFCAPVGAVGVTSAGTPMVCGPTANSSRARWHRG